MKSRDVAMSSLGRWWRLMREVTTVSMSAICYEAKYPMPPIFIIVSHLLETLQFISLALRVATLGGLTQVAPEIQYFDYVLFTRYSGPDQAIFSFFAAISLVCGTVALRIALGIQATSRWKYNESTRVPLARPAYILSWSCSTFLALPIVFSLVQLSNCNESTRLVLDRITNNIDCGNTLHTGLAVLGWLMLFLFVLLVGFHLFLCTDQTPTAVCLSAQVQGRGSLGTMMLRFCSVIVICIGTKLLGDWLTLAVLGVTSLSSIVVHLSRFPKTTLYMNAFAGGCATACIWACIGAVVALTVSTYDVTIMVLLGSPIAGTAGYLGIQIYLSSIIVKSLDQLRTPFEYALWARVRLQNAAHIHKKLLHHQSVHTILNDVNILSGDSGLLHPHVNQTVSNVESNPNSKPLPKRSNRTISFFEGNIQSGAQMDPFNLPRSSDESESDDDMFGVLEEKTKKETHTGIPHRVSLRTASTHSYERIRHSYARYSSSKNSRQPTLSSVEQQETNQTSFGHARRRFTSQQTWNGYHNQEKNEATYNENRARFSHDPNTLIRMVALCYEQLLRKHRDSEFALLCAATFYKLMHKTRVVEQTLLANARRQTNAIDINFHIHLRECELCYAQDTNINGQKSDNKAKHKGFTDAKRFSSFVSLAQQAESDYLNILIQLWSSLRSTRHKVRVSQLRRFAQDLYKARHRAIEQYENAMAANASNAGVIRLYANFLEQHVCDFKLHADLLAQADKVESATVTHGNRNLHKLVLGKRARPVDISDERVIVLTISAEPQRAGEILSIHGAASTPFGYLQEDLIGRECTILFPPLIDMVQQIILHEFISCGDGIIVKGAREMLLQNSEGEMFPAIVEFQEALPIPGDISPRMTVSIEPCLISKGILLCEGIPTELGVISACARSHGVAGTHPDDLHEIQLNLMNWFLTESEERTSTIDMTQDHSSIEQHNGFDKSRRHSSDLSFFSNDKLDQNTVVCSEGTVFEPATMMDTKEEQLEYLTPADALSAYFSNGDFSSPLVLPVDEQKFGFSIVMIQVQKIHFQSVPEFLIIQWGAAPTMAPQQRSSVSPSLPSLIAPRKSLMSLQSDTPSIINRNHRSNYSEVALPMSTSDTPSQGELITANPLRQNRTLTWTDSQENTLAKSTLFSFDSIESNERKLLKNFKQRHLRRPNQRLPAVISISPKSMDSIDNDGASLNANERPIDTSLSILPSPLSNIQTIDKPFQVASNKSARNTMYNAPDGKFIGVPSPLRQFDSMGTNERPLIEEPKRFNSTEFEPEMGYNVEHERDEHERDRKLYQEVHGALENTKTMQEISVIHLRRLIKTLLVFFGALLISFIVAHDVINQSAISSLKDIRDAGHRATLLLDIHKSLLELVDTAWVGNPMRIARTTYSVQHDHISNLSLELDALYQDLLKQIKSSNGLPKYEVDEKNVLLYDYNSGRHTMSTLLDAYQRILAMLRIVLELPSDNVRLQQNDIASVLATLEHSMISVATTALKLYVQNTETIMENKVTAINLCLIVLILLTVITSGCVSIRAMKSLHRKESQLLRLIFRVPKKLIHRALKSMRQELVAHSERSASLQQTLGAGNETDTMLEQFDGEIDHIDDAMEFNLTKNGEHRYESIVNHYSTTYRNAKGDKDRHTRSWIRYCVKARHSIVTFTKLQMPMLFVLAWVLTVIFVVRNGLVSLQFETSKTFLTQHTRMGTLQVSANILSTTLASSHSMNTTYDGIAAAIQIQADSFDLMFGEDVAGLHADRGSMALDKVGSQLYTILQNDICSGGQQLCTTTLLNSDIFQDGMLQTSVLYATNTISLFDQIHQLQMNDSALSTSVRMDAIYMLNIEEKVFATACTRIESALLGLAREHLASARILLIMLAVTFSVLYIISCIYVDKVASKMQFSLVYVQHLFLVYPEDALKNIPPIRTAINRMRTNENKI